MSERYIKREDRQYNRSREEGEKERGKEVYVERKGE